MKVEIAWAGIDANTGRVWGYLLDREEQPVFSYYGSAKTFWGSKNGKIYFQSAKQDDVFWRNVIKKRAKYNIQCPSLLDKVSKEYEQVLIMKRLAHGG